MQLFNIQQTDKSKFERKSIQFIFKSQIIRDHGDKFRIGGLSSIILDGVSEIGIEGIHVTSVPRDLDGVEAELVKACESV